MTRHSWLIVLLAVILACSGAGDSEQVASSTAALDIPGALPVPINGWEGSLSDLYIADAWASCSFVAASSDHVAVGGVPYMVDAEPHDAYMDTVRGYMDATTCSINASDTNLLHRWYVQRTTDVCNIVPGTTSNVPASLTPELVVGPIYAFDFTLSDYDIDPIIRAPAVDACIARKLRTIVPGAAGPSSLLLSASDQRELLEYTRERAQQAVVGYAKLIQLANDNDVDLGNILSEARNWLQAVAQPSSLSDQRRGLITADFLATAQTLSLVSSELLELYSRSASAKVPRGGPSTLTTADDAWGRSSWRHRALSLLYGGDPLAQPNGTGPEFATPWRHPFVAADPDVRYVSVDVRSPNVDALLQLAKRYDALNLKQQSSLDPSTHCIEVDLNPSVDQLYRAVEAGIETDDCEVEAPTGSLCVQATDCQVGERCIAGNCQACKQVDATALSLPLPSVDYSHYVLWNKYGIAFADASALIALLAQEVGRNCQAGENQSIVQTETEGGLDILGKESVVTILGQPYYHVDKSARRVPRSPLERLEGAYNLRDSEAAHARAALFLDGSESSQGYYSQPSDVATLELENRRETGVVPAMAMVRETLYLAQAAATLNGAGYLLDTRPQIQNLIGAAAGTKSFLLESPLAVDGGSGDVIATGDPALVLYTAPDDAFWNDAKSSNYTLYSTRLDADQRGWLTGNFFVEPNAQSFRGLNLAQAISTALSSSTSPAVVHVDDLKQPLRRWTFLGVGRADSNGLHAGTLGVTLSDTNGSQYQLLGVAAGLPGAHGAPLGVSLGGALNTTAERLVKAEEDDPSQPKFDAFGFPVRWMPPTDPTLLGSSASNPSNVIYLQDAQQAADSAVAAVTIAFNTLLEQQKAGIDQTVQQQKATQVIQATNKALCGEHSDGECSLGLADIDTLSKSNRTHLQDLLAKTKKYGCPPPIPDQNTVDFAAANEAALACAALTIYQSYDGAAKVATPVHDILVSIYVSGTSGTTTPPTFDNYSGGSAQRILLEQYFSYSLLQQQLEQVWSAYQLAQARSSAAETAFQSIVKKADNNCGPGAMAAALVSGLSASAGFATATVSFSLGPLMAQIQKCNDVTTDVAPAQANAIAAFAQAVNDMANETLAATQSAERLVLAVAQGSEEFEKGKLAKEQAALDNSLASLQLPNLASYRSYHNYDVWRANALLESARRYAVVARRSIEARYVVDLSQLHDDEPFVAGPAQWADQVYEYDLNAPTAVGLSLAPQQTTGTVYPNALVDYVGNLQRFVKGYPVKRPTAATLSDSEVVSLPGPKGLATQGSLPNGVIDGQAYKWTYFCPDSASWVMLPDAGNPRQACGQASPPTQAKLQFTLDPWARVDGTIGRNPFTKRYNERWVRFAVNLVGTGLLDCDKATDPLTCYSQAFVRYDLRHDGPGWTTDYNQQWRSLLVPVGTVESGKALAAEEWLDPLANGWSKSFVTAIARTELAEQPFGGGYTLTFALAPEVDLSHLERVQVLLESAYWVKEQ